MKIQFRKLIPTPLEPTAGVFLALAIVLAANSKKLLNYYGLQGSDQLLKSDAGNTVSQGLKTVDSFSVTNSVVTFLIWAVVGMICFSFVEALGSAYQQIKLDRQVSSRNYIHPVSFSQLNFWRGVILDMFTLVFGLAALGTISILFIVLIMPVGLAYSRLFLFDLSLANFLDLVLGIVIILAGLLLCDVLVRFLLYRRKVIRLN